MGSITQNIEHSAPAAVPATPLAALRLLLADIESGLIGVQLDIHSDNWNERLYQFASHLALAQAAAAAATEGR